MKTLAQSHTRLLLGALTLLIAFGAGTAQALAAPGIASIGGEIRADAAGTAAVQAGSHPDETVVEFNLNQHEREYEFGIPATVPDGNIRTSITDLPPGLIGNPMAVQHCSTSAFESGGLAGACPAASQIGIAEVTLTNFSGAPEVQYAGLFDIAPVGGEAARFAGRLEAGGAEAAAVVLTAGVRTGEGPGGGYGVTLTDANVPSALPILDVRVTFWGNPYSHEHDKVRGTCLTIYGPTGGECPVEGVVAPSAFTRLPTSCDGNPLEVTESLDFWEQPGVFTSVPFDFETEGAPNLMGGCEALAFSPTLTAATTTSRAESPTGLDVKLQIPQNEAPAGNATPDLRGAELVLPEGMTVNPAAANGLAACVATGIELAGPGQASPAACPDPSRIGKVTIATPLLDHPLEGSIYLARQGENKYGSLLAIYLAVSDPRSGVVLKIPGRIATSASGRLTATFADTPQLPFESLDASFSGGPDAVLMTPPACGSYTIAGSFTPWSGTAPVPSVDSFRIDSGPNGGACPSGGFSPALEAGTANPVAAAFSPFTLAVGRADGEARLASIQATLPPGLLAKLAGVPYCPDSALASVSGAEESGVAELARPSCPAASRVGSVTVGAGAGPSPFYLHTGSAYLAGPYKGAPLSLAVVTPALAGPFDLGSVVVRVALRVDPNTTRVTAVSDPLPTVLHGIPLDLREVRVELDRGGFIVNPTSCAPSQVASTIAAVGGALAHPAVGFGATECARLPFAPKLSLALQGASGRTGNPALRAELTAPAGQSNLALARVLLPRSEFIDQAHVRGTCTRVEFAAERCPAGSVLGTARAWSPLLGAPLEGPVYFRSNGGERKLPDIVADLRGQIGVVLVGVIDSVRQKGSEASRVRTTFASIPDAPVSKFVLRLRGGKRGLLENSVDLCAGPQRAGVSFVGQNGRRRSTSEALKVKGCGGR